MHARAQAEAAEQLSRVREAAEGLRQAEADRKARGLLARLRAVVPGGGDGGGDDMRRIVRRASWRPEAVLRRLWARMRASWWHGWDLARLRPPAGEVAASRCR